MYEISYRPAELGGGKFTHITAKHSPEDAQDEILGWMGPHPHSGDLVRVVKCLGKGIPLGTTDHLESPYEKLHVFDGAKGAFIEVDSHPAHVSWVNFWEGSANLNNMLDVAKLVCPRRLVLAACSFAEISIRNTGPNRRDCTAALKLVRNWARGREGTAPFLRPTRETLTKAVVPATNPSLATKAVCLTTMMAEWVSCEPNWDGTPLSNKGRVTNEMFRVAFCAMSSQNVNRKYIPSADPLLKTFVPILRHYVPLSVIACSRVGAQDPLPLPK